MTLNKKTRTSPNRLHVKVKRQVPDSMETTIISHLSSEEQLDSMEAIIKPCKLLSVDCEGVDLGRGGTLCLVQMSTPARCFLFDVLNCKRGSRMHAFLECILEDASVTKIIHDCKMDSDALCHCMGITLAGVHDTQACNVVLQKGGELNLNDTLARYGLCGNVVRDSSVYQQNLSFWAVRPMTPTMIQWASGDVACLFDLYYKQVEGVDGLKLRQFQIVSEKNAKKLPSMEYKEISIACNTGAFAGKRGANLHVLQRKLPNTFLQFRGKRGDGKITLYASDSENMQAIEAAVRALEKRAMASRF